MRRRSFYPLLLSGLALGMLGAGSAAHAQIGDPDLSAMEIAPLDAWSSWDEIFPTTKIDYRYVVGGGPNGGIVWYQFRNTTRYPVTVAYRVLYRNNTGTVTARTRRQTLGGYGWFRNFVGGFDPRFVLTDLQR